MGEKALYSSCPLGTFNRSRQSGRRLGWAWGEGWWYMTCIQMFLYLYIKAWEWVLIESWKRKTVSSGLVCSKEWKDRATWKEVLGDVGYEPNTFHLMFLREMQIELEFFLPANIFGSWTVFLNELLCWKQATWTLGFIWVMFELNPFTWGLLADWSLYTISGASGHAGGALCRFAWTFCWYHSMYITWLLILPRFVVFHILGLTTPKTGTLPLYHSLGGDSSGQNQSRHKLLF